MKRKMMTLVIVMSLALAALPAPAAARQGTLWFTEFFDNAYLLGDPVVEGQVGEIAFNWGANAPDSEVPADGWSARFGTDIEFAAGSYRFYILADDGVKLWIDYAPLGTLAINTYDDPEPGQLLTADVTLDAGFHHIQIDYREVTGDAYLYFDWESLADGAQQPNFPAPVTPITQWTAQYFNNVSLTGSAQVVQTEDSPSHNWGAEQPVLNVGPDYWSGRWTATYDLPAGTYEVSAFADDGVRVLINNQFVIDQWHIASGYAYTGTITLLAGQYPVVIEYYEDIGNAYLEFSLVRTDTTETQVVTLAATDATATVTAWRLNVRNAPMTGTVIAKIDRGETYPVVARNADSSWWQIQVGTQIGWVSGRYVTVTNSDSVPYADGMQPVTSPTVSATQCPGFLASRLTTGGYGRVVSGFPVYVRTQPGPTASLVGQISVGGVFQVLEGPVCADNSAWWRVTYFGITGWTMEGQSVAYWLEPYTP